MRPTSCEPNGQTAQSFHQSVNFAAHGLLGLHFCGDRAIFRVLAPHATAVFAVGDFNGWQTDCPLHRITTGGIWEGEVAGERVADGSLYKFRMESPHEVSYRADPYARRAAPPPETASVVHRPDTFAWSDAAWLAYRRRAYAQDGGATRPINIYELHLGSHRRNADGSYYSYRQYAAELPSYLKQMGYTHVELLPVAAHPFDGSWGYQTVSYFAPDARFGTPTDFKALIDALHAAGIGVILDWTPAHFPCDEHGLALFDGAPLYEYADPSRQTHRVWGTHLFDLGRTEVRSFLCSCAVHWINEYHVDGLRTDAVAAMLYLDYDRAPDEWTPNTRGDNRAEEGIAFLRTLNAHLEQCYPDVLRFAEESGDFGGVTAPVSQGGLGFSYKWDLGAQNDLLFYSQLPYEVRREHHGRLTFPVHYAYNERYCLPISHDEVVHGKRSLLDRMPGDYAQKFAAVRATLGYQMTHPSKKLLFMGCEIGQFVEWNHQKSIEWFLLDYPSHAALQAYVAALNHFYLANPPLYEQDHVRDGFLWMDPDNDAQSIYTYVRTDRAGNRLLVVLNFSPVAYPDYRVGVPCAGVYTEVFTSDERSFGGGGMRNADPIPSAPIPIAKAPHSISISLPPLSCVILAAQ